MMTATTASSATASELKSQSITKDTITAAISQPKAAIAHVFALSPKLRSSCVASVMFFLSLGR